eukprot:364833-Chlamydomonas_euryale.AAC.8
MANATGGLSEGSRDEWGMRRHRVPPPTQKTEALEMTATGGMQDARTDPLPNRPEGRLGTQPWSLHAAQPAQCIDAPRHAPARASAPKCLPPAPCPAAGRLPPPLPLTSDLPYPACPPAAQLMPTVRSPVDNKRLVALSKRIEILACVAEAQR